MSAKVKKLKNENSHGALFKRLFKDIKPIYPMLIIVVFIATGAVFCNLFSPRLLGRIIDALNQYMLDTNAGLVASIDMAYIGKMAIQLLIIYGTVCILTIAKMLIMNNVVSRYFTAELRIKISDKLKRLPISYVDTTPQGEIISRMTSDVSVVGNSVHELIDLAILGVVQIIGISYMIFTINWVLALLVILIIPSSLIIATILANKSEKHFDAAQTTNGKLYSFVEESYSGQKTIIAYNLQNEQEKKHSVINEELKNSAIKGNYLGDIVQPIISFTNSLGYILICLVGAIMTINNTISIGDVLAIILYSKLFAGPLEGIASSLSLLQKTFASAKRVYNIIDKDEMEKQTDPLSVSNVATIKFDDISFSYNKTEPLIEHLSFEANVGQRIAIVGPTGGGKTTIMNLLMRFYDVDKGNIYIGGEDISTHSRESLRDKIAMVLQDTWLFHGTIYDNIAYGKTNVTMEEVISASESAFTHNFISALNDGYNTILNEDSTNISTGQKQLLTIARAFLSDKDILVFDEATSNIDTRTEILIQHALKKLAQNKTCFIIAHRLSTIVDADLILVVDNGHVVEQGKHLQLLQQNGLYSEIYQSQYSLHYKQ